MKRQKFNGGSTQAVYFNPHQYHTPTRPPPSEFSSFSTSDFYFNRGTSPRPSTAQIAQAASTPVPPSSYQFRGPTNRYYWTPACRQYFDPYHRYFNQGRGRGGRQAPPPPRRSPPTAVPETSSTSEPSTSEPVNSQEATGTNNVPPAAESDSTSEQPEPVGPEETIPLPSILEVIPEEGLVNTEDIEEAVLSSDHPEEETEEILSQEADVETIATFEEQVNTEDSEEAVVSIDHPEVTSQPNGVLLIAGPESSLQKIFIEYADEEEDFVDTEDNEEAAVSTDHLVETEEIPSQGDNVESIVTSELNGPESSSQQISADCAVNVDVEEKLVNTEESKEAVVSSDHPEETEEILSQVDDVETIATFEEQVSTEESKEAVVSIDHPAETEEISSQEDDVETIVTTKPNGPESSSHQISADYTVDADVKENLVNTDDSEEAAVSIDHLAETEEILSQIDDVEAIVTSDTTIVLPVADPESCSQQISTGNVADVDIENSEDAVVAIDHRVENPEGISSQGDNVETIVTPEPNDLESSCQQISTGNADYAMETKKITFLENENCVIEQSQIDSQPTKLETAVLEDSPSTDSELTASSQSEDFGLELIDSNELTEAIVETGEDECQEEKTCQEETASECSSQQDSIIDVVSLDDAEVDMSIQESYVKKIREIHTVKSIVPQGKNINSKDEDDSESLVSNEDGISYSSPVGQDRQLIETRIIEADTVKPPFASADLPVRTSDDSAIVSTPKDDSPAVSASPRKTNEFEIKKKNVESILEKLMKKKESEEEEKKSVPNHQVEVLDKTNNGESEMMIFGEHEITIGAEIELESENSEQEKPLEVTRKNWIIESEPATFNVDDKSYLKTFYNICGNLRFPPEMEPIDFLKVHFANPFKRIACKFFVKDVFYSDLKLEVFKNAEIAFVLEETSPRMEIKLFNDPAVSLKLSEVSSVSMVPFVRGFENLLVIEMPAAMDDLVQQLFDSRQERERNKRSDSRLHFILWKNPSVKNLECTISITKELKSSEETKYNLSARAGFQVLDTEFTVALETFEEMKNTSFHFEMLNPREFMKKAIGSLQEKLTPKSQETAMEVQVETLLASSSSSSSPVLKSGKRPSEPLKSSSVPIKKAKKTQPSVPQPQPQKSRRGRPRKNVEKDDDDEYLPPSAFSKKAGRPRKSRTPNVPSTSANPPMSDSDDSDEEYGGRGVRFSYGDFSIRGMSEQQQLEEALKASRMDQSK